MNIVIANAANFREESLDDFQRFQRVRLVYRVRDGELAAEENPFDEDWILQKRRERSRQIAYGGYLTFCAFEEGRVVGFLMLLPTLYRGNLIVYRFYVSKEFRRRGIGRALFEKAKEAARHLKADALWISACPAKETVDFYLAVGCELMTHPLPEFVDTKPHDIPLECRV